VLGAHLPGEDVSQWVSENPKRHRDVEESGSEMEAKLYSTMLGDKELSIETGKVAKLVSGSVVVRYGDTMLLATAQGSDRPSNLDFLPLTVEFEERHYAIGKIPGSFMRRESRPGEKAILSSRITDRQIRPLFPKGYKFETQVIITVLSADQQNTPDVLGPIAASAALSISDIPWDGPCATVRVGRVDGNFIINPTLQQLELSDLDIVVAGTKDAVLMVECAAKELNEDVMVSAIEFAHAQMQGVIELISQMQAEVGHAKTEWKPEESLESIEAKKADLEVVSRMTKERDLKTAILTPGKKAKGAATKAVRESIIAELAPTPTSDDKEVLEAHAARVTQLKGVFDKAQQIELRRMVIEDNVRADGRNPQTVRPISIETNYLPRTHGSSLFTRGETQVLGTVTLGTGKDEQIIDDLGLDDGDKFLLHYNFPPYSTGEVKRLGGQSRREIGHGVLAKRALKAVLPSYDSFPYVIRVVGDVLESNGSSSMATVCAGTLALMDAGVPISAPVAGVAMGLVKEGDKYAILTDILGMEDALGDMDFKVCGTRKGVSALQMDIKIKGITPALMREALEQAKDARILILDKIEAAISAPRAELNVNAPRIITVKIPVDKIGSIIGPGGKNIRELEQMGAQINIEEDGTVRIYSADAAAAEAVKARIMGATETAKLGQEYDGKVVKLMEFGAFVNIMPGTDGMIHISQLSEQRVNKVEDVLNVGDTLRVKVVNIDDRGKIDLTRPELEGKVAPRTPRAPREGGDRGRSGGRDRR
jgi:polyribonucleotide nucleotidyltransferase